MRRVTNDQLAGLGLVGTFLKMGFLCVDLMGPLQLRNANSHSPEFALPIVARVDEMGAPFFFRGICIAYQIGGRQ